MTRWQQQWNDDEMMTTRWQLQDSKDDDNETSMTRWERWWWDDNDEMKMMTTWQGGETRIIGSF